MNFTREPIIETVITPRDGCKLVIRSSKSGGQEEYIVDAIEVVSFGQALFFRSIERPKSFIVPVTDYEVIEVREVKMTLKASPTEKGIKIGGGRESSKKGNVHDKEEAMLAEGSEGLGFEKAQQDSSESSATTDARSDKKRDRRKGRKRKPRTDENGDYDLEEPVKPPVFDDLSESYMEDSSEKHTTERPRKAVQEDSPMMQSFGALLPPPTTLISDTISMYKGHSEYKKAFFEESKELEQVDDVFLKPSESDFDAPADDFPHSPPLMDD